MQIIQMASQGTRPCAISRKLRVSHGCVSKILQRYSETGSIKPGSIGGSKPRATTPIIEAKMDQYRTECPGILCYEIRRRLIDEKVCDQNNIPSVSVIAKYLRKKNNTGSDSNQLCESSLDTANENFYKAETLEDNISENKNLASVISLTHSRRLRTSFTQKQIEVLESIFKHTHYPDANLREDIGQTTSLSDNKIQIWFSNRRAKWRKTSTQGTISSTVLPTTAPREQAPILTTSQPSSSNNIYESKPNFNYNSSTPIMQKTMSPLMSQSNLSNISNSSFTASQNTHLTSKDSPLNNYNQYMSNNQDSIVKQNNYNSNLIHSTPFYSNTNLPMGSNFQNKFSIDSPASSTCSTSPSSNQYNDYMKSNSYYYQTSYYNQFQKEVPLNLYNYNFQLNRINFYIY